MNGVADMGGMHGFGPVIPSAEWKPFAAEWERRVLGIQFATLSAGLFPVDQIRFVTESLPAAKYLSSSYFERWLDTVELLLLENGVVTAEELASGRPAQPPATCEVTPEVARQVMLTGGSARAEGGRPARFKPGDRVRARVMNPAGHTRLPRYVRGHVGEVIRDYGTFVFPDSNASGKGHDPQHVYCVRFRARDLWGPEAAEADSLQIDLFDDYLDPAHAGGNGGAP
jgi:nitrile hydratase